MSLQDFLLYALKRTTVDENIIATIKTRNIELFSVTPHLVIALPTLR